MRAGTATLPRSPTGLLRLHPTAAALCSWSLLIVIAALWGAHLNDVHAGILLPAPPLYGQPDFHAGARLALAALLASGIVWFGPTLAQRLRWKSLLGVSALAAAAWAIALALAGPPGLAEPLRGSTEYLASVELVRSPGAFLSNFTAQLDIYTVHVRGHPPGMVLFFWGLGQAGLGAGAAAALIIAAAASAVPAALIAARELAGPAAARAAAPFLVLAPAAIWIATSADALFMAVGAWAVALAVLALRREGRKSQLLAALAGFVFGLGLVLSYGLLLLAAVPVAVAIGLRRVRPLLVAAAAMALVLLAFGALGFWWPDGVAATREQYLAGIAARRPFDFFALNNLAALAVALGPAVAAGLAGLRDRRLWLLVGGACAAVVLADLSGMSKGEVERIWLPFMPWLLLATAALGIGRGARAWLGAQAACALAITALVLTPW